MGQIVVVGAGFSGAVIAREIAEKMNRSVTVFEKRRHIAGNMFDETDEYGILVQRYGPHVLVTNEWFVIEYLSQFAEMFQHTVKELSYIDGEYIRLPFNFESIQQLLGYKRAGTVINKLRRFYCGVDRVPVLDLVNHEDADISDFANLLFEKSYKTYCSKQWDVPTEKLDKAIMGRSAIALSYDERYMNKDFQFLPKDGFTKMFENILDHPNISVQLNTDALKHITFDEIHHNVLFDRAPLEILVFTGPIDELLGMKYGELPYRSLDIRYEWFNVERMYPEKIISYPQATGCTRKTEYKFMMYEPAQAVGTTIATEYPIAYMKNGSATPFYPVITDENIARYSQYCEEIKQYENVFLCGRLAEFKYYNMDDCILRALKISGDIKRKLSKKAEGE